jgi:predicted RNase H-like HicB family nuclease
LTYTIEIDREEDGRYIAAVPELPGVLVYGTTEEEAKAKAEALALRVIAEEVETANKPIAVSFACGSMA